MSEVNRSKDDPVLIDWNNKTNNDAERYTNRTKDRAQASLADAENFFSQHVSQLDAVSEVDSQMGATPFSANNEGKNYLKTTMFPQR